MLGARSLERIITHFLLALFIFFKKNFLFRYFFANSLINKIKSMNDFPY